MTPIRDIMNTRWNLFAALGVILVWSTTAATNTWAQDDHTGHDHASHADDAGHDEPAEEKHVEGEGEEHDGHSDEEGEDAHGEEVVLLSDTELEEFGVTLQIAQAGVIDESIELPGEIALNADRIAHVVPRVSGIVRKVHTTVGDQVTEGQLLAVLESRELADAKGLFLASIERQNLAQTNFQREENLWKTKVTSEMEYLDARQALAEARIVMSSAEQQLHALGFNEADLQALAASPHASFTHYTITAPFSGTVIEKHITFGENVGADADVFTIADLSSVWLNVDVYQKDLVSIRKGLRVLVEMGHGMRSVEGEIAWIAPQVDEGTRTATARVVLENSDGNLRPGLFVTVNVAISSTPAEIVVPKSALQTFEGKNVVFVRTDKGFEPKPVEIGRQNGDMAEVISGLAAGQTYVSTGAFTLKAQLSKGAFGDGHNH